MRKIANLETKMAEWEKNRKAGIWFHMLLLGPLSGGIGFFFGRVVFDFLFTREFERISFYVLTSYIFGFLFGLGYWVINEKKYKRYKKKKH
ncbi:hypothetical protein FZW96_12920 [Bacillus sp. BGMRC 2118]|nr:hypothetical protein FZW96_12920 [Bacillus sp. BGMRC 2118]